MMHVKQIRNIIEEGRSEEAHEAIDQLLALGPHNTEALKLRAMLYGRKGRFAEEARTWERIIGIDNEDPDAISYFQMRHLEDREHFYFTDDLPDGGRRFIAYPRHLIRSTFLALGGCLAFLSLTRLTVAFPLLEAPGLLLPLFAVLVIAPWIWTLVSWLRAIHHVSLTRDRIEFATRLKTLWLDWKAIEGIFLAHNTINDSDTLSLVIVPKNRDLPVVEVDLSAGSSSIRARSYLLKEIAAHFGEPVPTARRDIQFGTQPTVKF